MHRFPLYMRRITVSRLRFCSVTYSSAHAVFLQAIALCVFAVTVEAAPPLRQKSFLQNLFGECCGVRVYAPCGQIRVRLVLLASMNP